MQMRFTNCLIAIDVRYTEWSKRTLKEVSTCQIKKISYYVFIFKVHDNHIFSFSGFQLRFYHVLPISQFQTQWLMRPRIRSCIKY